LDAENQAEDPQIQGADVYGSEKRPNSTANYATRADKRLFVRKREHFLAQRTFNRSGYEHLSMAEKRQRSVHQQALVNDLILNNCSNPNFNYNLQLNRI